MPVILPLRYAILPLIYEVLQHVLWRLFIVILVY